MKQQRSIDAFEKEEIKIKANHEFMINGNAFVVDLYCEEIKTAF